MSADTDPHQHKQDIADLFDTVAQGYDHTALRWFPIAADAVIDWLSPQSGSRLLDVATGTAVVAISAAQKVQPGGQVTAVDLSDNMLAMAANKANLLSLNNIEFHKMDAENLEFENNYFDYVTCSFGLFFLPDMEGALTEWRRVTRPGGKVVFTSFKQSAFQPLLKLFIEQLEEFGADMSEQEFSTQRLVEEDVCQGLLQQAGFDDIVINNKQCGYHLQDVDDWWAILWNAGARAFLHMLEEDKLPSFKKHHLNSVQELFDNEGSWLDVEINIASGTVS